MSRSRYTLCMSLSYTGNTLQNSIAKEFWREVWGRIDMAESLCCTLKTITTLLISYGGLVCKSSLTLETPWTVAYHAPLSMGFSTKNNGVGCHFLPQGIFPIQGLYPCLFHCRQILHQLSYQGIPNQLYSNIKYNKQLKKERILQTQPVKFTITPY